MNSTFSTHFRKTTTGLDFEDFLPNDEYKEHIIAPFDDFLHESFSMFKVRIVEMNVSHHLLGSEICERRAQGMPGSKDGSPVGDKNDDSVESDNEATVSCAQDEEISNYDDQTSCASKMYLETKKKNMEDNLVLLQRVEDEIDKSKLPHESFDVETIINQVSMALDTIQRWVYYYQIDWIIC